MFESTKWVVRLVGSMWRARKLSSGISPSGPRQLPRPATYLLFDNILTPPRNIPDIWQFFYPAQQHTWYLTIFLPRPAKYLIFDNIFTPPSNTPDIWQYLDIASLKNLTFICTWHYDKIANIAVCCSFFRLIFHPVLDFLLESVVPLVTNIKKAHSSTTSTPGATALF